MKAVADSSALAAGRAFRAAAALAAIGVILAPLRADGGAGRPVDASSWELAPAVVTGLFCGAALYASGRRWMRPTRAGARASLCFWSGWVLLALALTSPLHRLGQQLFAAHMVQHELLMVVIAPLLVLGRPERTWLRAMPRSLVRAAAGPLHAVGIGRAWNALTHPLVATVLHAAALWLWHVPVWFLAARSSDFVHALQHASFLLTAVLFWHALLFGRGRRARSGVAVLYLFVTAMHSSALGALLTFSNTAWYASPPGVVTRWGLSALDDQQLGGLIMWVPGGLTYLGAALYLFSRWLRPSHDFVGATLKTPGWERRSSCAPSV